MSVANPSGSTATPRPGPGTWGPIALAGAIVVVVLIGLVVVRLLDGGARSTPGSALSTLTSALQDGDVHELQAVACDGWPAAPADVAALGRIDTVVVLDGPKVDGGSGAATIGVGDDAPRTSPSPTSSADAAKLTADFQVAVGLSYVDGRWCVSSFDAKPVG